VVKVKPLEVLKAPTIFEEAAVESVVEVEGEPEVAWLRNAIDAHKEEAPPYQNLEYKMVSGVGKQMTLICLFQPSNYHGLCSNENHPLFPKSSEKPSHHYPHWLTGKPNACLASLVLQLPTDVQLIVDHSLFCRSLWVPLQKEN
jgi:hypothetical protein